MKLIVLFLVSCYCVYVQSQIFNGNNNNLQQQPTTPPAGTTTTVASAAYQRCYNNCQQYVTKQYSPVCASNGQSFTNIRLLECAQRCGLRAQYESPGTCGPSPGGK